MPAVFRYFWFFTAAVMLANVMFWRGRVLQLVALDRLSADEANRFMRIAVLGITIPCIALGVINLWAGYPMPMCWAPFAPHSAPDFVASLIALGWWGALLGWIWLGRGADLIGRIWPALGRNPKFDRTYSPRTIKLAVTGLLLVSGIGNALITASSPRSSMCQEATAS